MFASFLIAGAALLTTTALAPQDPDQAVKVSNDGEFIAKNYPPRALKAREQGKVGFRLVVESDGSLGSCEVTESSGSNALDNETCELILRHARLNPVRNADGRAVRAVQSGFIVWKLPPGIGRQAGVKTADAGALPDKIICKKSAATGSLIRRTRQCMSAREWGEAQRIARDTLDRLIAKGFTNEPCNPLSSPECI